MRSSSLKLIFSLESVDSLKKFVLNSGCLETKKEKISKEEYFKLTDSQGKKTTNFDLRVSS